MSRLCLLATLAVLAAACGNETGEPGSRQSVVVFAAASLGDAFTEMEQAFEEAKPGYDIRLNFGGSSSLRQQLLEGAPADVFASADQSNMDSVVEEGLIGGDSDVVFARNRMTIAVPAGNEAGLESLADFADTELLLGLCAETVPCGRFAREVLANAGVVASLDTNEPDVRALLTKIEAGELDGAIVYHTDTSGSADLVESVAIPDAQNVDALYPIAPLASASNPDGAAEFIAYVTGDQQGQAILAEQGFLSP